ncbi:hypothetical protein [Gandjariella thermophila]|uniref:hypothetical protein n=1 Tax=Gandjariella thermophila TaxID=1931992 RepID=UPI0027D975B6|nr:hypothetical protein [Gandjariella thermophila]
MTRHQGVCRPRASEDGWGTVLLLVRLRRGIVGEARRVVHLVPVPTEHVPAVLTAYCGAEIVPGTAEVLSCFTGVPCTPCLAAAPLPEDDR